MVSQSIPLLSITSRNMVGIIELYEPPKILIPRRHFAPRRNHSIISINTPTTPATTDNLPPQRLPATDFLPPDFLPVGSVVPALLVVVEAGHASSWQLSGAHG